MLNLTPDSFYSGSRCTVAELPGIAANLLAAGADRLDIGAESSRPQAEDIGWQEEWRRLEPGLAVLRDMYGDNFLRSKVSVDTFRRETAQRALAMGVGCINDISGGADEEILRAVAQAQCEVVLMHMQGRPGTMQNDPRYADVVSEVREFLIQRTERALAAGILGENIIWDYGIGFGKTVEHNLRLLAATKEFLHSGYRLMVGVSRKSFLGKILDLPDPAQRGEATLIMHTWLAAQKVSILRTHDVANCVMIRRLLSAVEQYEN